MLSLLIRVYFQHSEQQSIQNLALNIWGERQAGYKQRVKILQGFRDTVAKIDADTHKARAKICITINRDRSNLLIQV